MYITSKGENIMSQIKVSPETLQSRAREYGKASNDITTILNNLQRLQDTLRGEWEGAAFQGFDNQFNENFAELMQQINTQLDKTAQAMQQNDQALSRNFGLN
jgi:WXG100 family type VII secretion target